MSALAQYITALILSLIIASAAPPSDYNTVAAITFLLTAIIIYSRNRDKNKKKTTNKKPEQNKVINQSQLFAWPTLMEFEFNIVGESYYQSAIAKLAREQETKYTNNPDAEIEALTAYLIPDDNNEYDDKAVRVEIKGMQVGYLSRDDARSFRRRLGNKKLTGQITTCGALITGGHIKDGKQMSYGVILDIKPFNQEE